MKSELPPDWPSREKSENNCRAEAVAVAGGDRELKEREIAVRKEVYWHTVVLAAAVSLVVNLLLKKWGF